MQLPAPCQNNLGVKFLWVLHKGMLKRFINLPSSSLLLRGEFSVRAHPLLDCWNYSGEHCYDVTPAGEV